MRELKNKKILLTGRNSMIGTATYRQLILEGAEVYPCTIDLIKSNLVEQFFTDNKFDYVVHCAGYNGGIQFNAQYPSTIYYKNVMIATNLLYHASKNVQKVVSILPSCAYADMGDNVYNEEDFENGPSNNTVRCHGHAKRTLYDYSINLYKEHNFISVCGVSNNSYGPLDSTLLHKTKVVMAAIKKIVDAKLNKIEEIVFFGTGNPKRSFVYCDDVGKALVNILKYYENPLEVINIDSGNEVTIKELVELICNIVGYEGKIVFDTSKPDGQMRKLLNSTKLQKLCPQNFTSLRDGLIKTIEWYKNENRVSSE